MAKLLGAELPSQLMPLFGTRRAEDVAGKALAMVTIDEQGCPHPGTASFAEIFAPDPGHLRVALWTNSSAARNLLERRKFALHAVHNGAAYYVKGEAGDLGADHAELTGQNLFWVTLSEIYEDREPGFEMSGLTFTSANDKMTEWWAQLFASVRSATVWPA